MDLYTSFTQLSRREREGRDYRIRWRVGGSGIAIVAPHGGGIERGTSEVADGIAGREHGFYAFEGLKSVGNHVLHLSSNRFDEPQAQTLAHRSRTVITIHGAKGREPAAYLGGLDLVLRERITEALIGAGFLAVDDPSPTRQGRSPSNICNRCVSGRGVQLELSYGLRTILFAGLDPSGLRRPTSLYLRFVGTLREVLAGHEPVEMRSVIAEK
ncbi:MAG: poly-gamma-glutamate hydrolase family protein [Gammaproteobacteria bacterium]